MMTTHALPVWLREVSDIRTNTSMPSWLVTSKQQAWDNLIKSGMPTRKHEGYKYTDFSFLGNKRYALSQQKDSGGLADFVAAHRVQGAASSCLVMVNGIFQPSLSDLETLPASVLAMTITDALIKHPDLLQQQIQQYASCYFADLNQALFTDGLFLHIPDHYQDEQLIHVLSITTEQNDSLIVPKNVFIIGKQADVHLLEEFQALHASTYFQNIVTHWQLQEGAAVHCYKKQCESVNASHMAQTFITQHQHSQFELVNVTTGSIFSRDNVTAHLQGAGANCLLSGFYTSSQASQYIDHHIEINHEAASSRSEMLYKGILDGASRAVFNGRLHVAKDAQRIHAYQANHHLLLSAEAEAYSKPELEIYADDVKCKHGATTGQLDEDALFYLQSRGIEKQQAMSILMVGFAEEVLRRITNPAVLAYMQEVL